MKNALILLLLATTATAQISTATDTLTVVDSNGITFQLSPTRIYARIDSTLVDLGQWTDGGYLREGDIVAISFRGPEAIGTTWLDETTGTISAVVVIPRYATIYQYGASSLAVAYANMRSSFVNKALIRAYREKDR
jgi:hypothetical protein